jgi:hypothetical protein
MAISFTMFELMAECRSPVIMITVSIFWSSFRFMWAIWYSYSKSEIARIPRTRTCASCSRANCTSRPRNDVTSTFPIVRVNRLSILTRSPGVK